MVDVKVENVETGACGATSSDDETISDYDKLKTINNEFSVDGRSSYDVRKTDGLKEEHKNSKPVASSWLEVSVPAFKTEHVSGGHTEAPSLHKYEEAVVKIEMSQDDRDDVIGGLEVEPSSSRAEQGTEYHVEPQLETEGDVGTLDSSSAPHAETSLPVCGSCNYQIIDPRHIECLVTYTDEGHSVYTCPVCDKTFRIKSKLKVHITTHSGVKPYTCTICNKSFRVKNKLNNHFRKHSGEKPYKCDICDKGFYESGNLRYHLTTHSGAKQFACEVCEKTFTYYSGLQRHMKVHTGDKPYSCHLCDKSFNENCNLQRHLRVHSGEKPYPCNICNKSFAESGHLQIHLRRHSGEKPFSCDICDKKFSVKSGLQRHSLLHTGFKPYSCAMCYSAFSEKGNLLKHIRTCTKKLAPLIPEIIYLKKHEEDVSVDT